MNSPRASRAARRDRTQAEALLAGVFERVTDAFVALDKDWRYTYVNARAGEIFGRRPSDLIGKHIWTEFPEGVGQPFHRAYERAMAEQKPVCFEDYYPPYDRWFENIVYPSSDGVSIYFHDITDRKRADALLAGQMRVMEMIAAGSALPEVLTAIVRLIESAAPGTFGSILLLDDDGVHVRHGAAPSLPAEFVAAVDGQPIGPSAGSCGTAAYRGKPVFVEDIATDPLWSAYKAAALPHGLRACWSTPIWDVQGRVIGTFAMYDRQPGLPKPWHQQLIDIATHTAAVAISRQRAEAALRDKTDELDHYFTNSLDLLCIADTDGHFRRLNPEWQRTLGYELAELDGRRFLDFVHPDDLADTLGAMAALSSQRQVLNFVNRCRHKDGSYRWIEWRSYAAQGLIYAVARDVTDRKLAEDTLRRNEEVFRLFVEHSPAAIAMFDREMRYLAASRRYLVDYDLGEQQLVGRSHYEVFPEMPERWKQIHRRCLAGAIEKCDEDPFPRADGTIDWVRWEVRPWAVSDGGIAGLILFSEVITERKRAEEQVRLLNAELEQRVLERTAQLAAKNEELKTFAYTVSHDLKAPLRGIAGYAQELERRHKDGLGERAQFCISQVLAAARNLDRLIEDLLTYSRLDAETPTPTDVGLGALVDAILRDRHHALTELGIEVTVHVPPLTLRVWERGLNQVLSNLIDNAVTYSRHSTPPRLIITAEERPGVVLVSVADNGIGFDMKYHDRIFGLFNRLVRADQFEGTGAGLAIVKKLVEKLGGTVRAESQPGHGATFFVELRPQPITRIRL